MALPDEPTLADVDAALPGLTAGLAGGEPAQPPEAPALDLSSLFGNAPYEGREEYSAPTVEEPPRRAPAAPAAPAGPDPEVQRRLDELTARNAALEEAYNARETQAQSQAAEWQQAQERNAYYQQAAQRAAQAATLPEVNPDEILGDPARFRQYGQNLVNAAVTATLAQLSPAIQEHRENAAQTQALVRRYQGVAIESAAARIKNTYQYELTKQEQQQLVGRLRAAGREGEILAADPDQLVYVWAMDRVQRGLPVGGAAPPPKAPPTSPTHGSRRPARAGTVPYSSLPPAAKTIFARLGARTSDITQDELDSINIGGLRG